MTGFFSSEFFFHYRRNLPAVFGSALLAFFALLATLGPLLVAQDPYDVSQLELMDSFKPPAWLEVVTAGICSGPMARAATCSHPSSMARGFPPSSASPP